MVSAKQKGEGERLIDLLCRERLTDADRAEISALIREGAEVVRFMGWAWTPLHGAAWRGHAAFIPPLVEAGADPMAKNRDGKTALDHARDSRQQECVTLLEGYMAKTTSFSTTAIDSIYSYSTSFSPKALSISSTAPAEKNAKLENALESLEKLKRHPETGAKISKVSIISAPFKTAASTCAQLKANAEADGKTFCFNPDTDFHLFNVTAAAGSQGWMNCWIKIAQVAKQMGGTAYFIVNDATNTFPGSQQDGEHTAAKQNGCRIEYVRIRI